MKLDIRIETEFSPAFLRDAAGLYRLAEWVDKNDDCAFLGAALKTPARSQRPTMRDT